MMAAPPSEPGGLQDKVTWPLPAVAVSPVGGPGFRIRACGSRTAVRTAETPGSPLPAAVPSAASVAGQPTSTAARHVPATVVSHRPRGAADRARRAADCPGTAAGWHFLVRRKG